MEAIWEDERAQDLRKVTWKFGASVSLSVKMRMITPHRGMRITRAEVNRRMGNTVINTEQILKAHQPLHSASGQHACRPGISRRHGSGPRWSP